MLIVCSLFGADKFMQKYGKKLDPAEKETVESKVKEVFQMMNSARNPSPVKPGQGGYSGYSGYSGGGYSGYSGSSAYGGYSGSSYTSGVSNFGKRPSYTSGYGSSAYSNYRSTYR